MRPLLLLLLTLLAAACMPASGPTAPVGTVTRTPRPSATPEVGVSLATRAAPTIAVLRTTPQPLPTATATPSATPIIYVVEEGDTLLGIAYAHFTSLDALRALNPDVEPARLQIGQELQLPPPATALAPGVEATRPPLDVVVEQVALYQTPGGDLWVLGELHNSSVYPAAGVQVQVVLQGAGGEALASALAPAVPGVISPQRRAPFGVLVRQPTGHGAGGGAEGLSPGGLLPVVSIVEGEPLLDTGSYLFDLAVVEAAVQAAVQEEEQPAQVSGRVLNTGARPAQEVVVVATFYDEQGRISGFVVQWLESAVAPGEMVFFTMTAAPPGGALADYSIVAQGRSS